MNRKIEQKFNYGESIRKGFSELSKQNFVFILVASLFCAPSEMCASSNVYPNTRSFKYTINFRPIHTVYDESAERRTNFYGEWKFAMNNVMINEALCEPKRSGLVLSDSLSRAIG